MLVLRSLSTDDWPLWRDARVAALTESPHAFTARLADWDHGGERQWRERFETPGCHHVLASWDGRTVGMARGVPAGGDTAELRSVWVAAGARGLGIGDRLIAAVREWAVGAGYRALTLAVIPGNAAAVELYRRNGFADTGEPGGLLPDGATRERVMAAVLR